MLLTLAQSAPLPATPPPQHPWLFLAAFGVAGAILVVATVTAVRLLRRLRRTSVDPTCGHCGYIVRGLTTFTCPECGSDLREVGIIRAGRRQGRQRKLLGLLVPLGIRTALLGVVAWAISAGILWGLWPMKESLSDQCTFEGGAKDRVSIAFASIAVQKYLGTSRFASHWGGRSASFTLPSSHGSRQFFVTFGSNPSGQYSRGDGSTVYIQGVPTAADVKAYFSSNRRDIDDPQVAGEAEDLARFIAALDADPRLTATTWMGRNSNRLRVVNGMRFGAVSTVVEFDQFLFLWLIPWAGLIYWEVRRWRKMPPAGPLTGGLVPALRTTAATRTLTVVFSDIQGFTAATSAAPRAHALELSRRHQDLVAPIAKRLGGRIVKSLGDGLLLAFDSATDAVRAGLEIQAATAGSGDSFDSIGRLALRIGIATGEVVEADSDVFGQPVNLASRLQAMARAGDVVLAESTWATINRGEIECADLGAHQIKGFFDPVRVYRALGEPVVRP